jgi:hypothetical protein
VEPDDFDGILKLIRGQPIDGVESLLVYALRRTADRKAGVGKDCVAVVLASNATVIRFRPFRRQFAIVSARAPLPRSAAFFPWIIGPTVIMQPSLATGGGGVTETSFGDYPIVLEDSESQDSQRDDLFYSWNSFERRPWNG